MQRSEGRRVCGGGDAAKVKATKKHVRLSWGFDAYSRFVGWLLRAFKDSTSKVCQEAPNQLVMFERQ